MPISDKVVNEAETYEVIYERVEERQMAKSRLGDLATPHLIR